MQAAPTRLQSYPRFRPELKPAPFLPMSRREMEQLGWDACDIILITGDAYIWLLYSSDAAEDLTRVWLGGRGTVSEVQKRVQ